MNTSTTETVLLTAAQFLNHWRGHRALTRRVIEEFPENQLFTFTAGDMRSFGVIAWELHGVSADTMRGLGTGDWSMSPHAPSRKEKRTAHRRAGLLVLREPRDRNSECVMRPLFRSALPLWKLAVSVFL